MSTIGAPLAILTFLVPVVLLGVVLYLAVRFGVAHGMRDARRSALRDDPRPPHTGGPGHDLP